MVFIDIREFNLRFLVNVYHLLNRLCHESQYEILALPYSEKKINFKSCILPENEIKDKGNITKE